MADGDFIALQYARQHLAAQREPVDAVDMSAKVCLHIVNDLRCLVVNGGKPRMLAQYEAVDLHSHDAKPLSQPFDEWQEYLVGDAQPWDEQ